MSWTSAVILMEVKRLRKLGNISRSVVDLTWRDTCPSLLERTMVLNSIILVFRCSGGYIADLEMVDFMIVVDVLIPFRLGDLAESKFSSLPFLIVGDLDANQHIDIFLNIFSVLLFQVAMLILILTDEDASTDEA